MFRFLDLLLPFLILALLTGCRKPTEPLPPSGSDTTSHDFIWRTDTLGDGNSSVLNDVFIIDENNIWAVGRIYLKDTSGAFESPAYGAAHWDGIRWNPKRLPAQAPGYTSYLVPTGILAFSANDIWLTSGGVHKFNGSSVTQSYWINPFPGNPNRVLSDGQMAMKVWGTSSNDLYTVGTSGAIAHFNGTSWTKLESGTTTLIDDIWGAVDAKTGQTMVLAAVSDKYNAGEMRILSVSLQGVQDALNWTLGRRVTSLWFRDPSSAVYQCGSGVREYRNETWNEIALPDTFTNRIRGSDVNNVVVVGDFGLAAHYNGSTWHVWTELSNSLWQFQSVAVSGKTVAIVGFEAVSIGGRAVAVIGRRN